MDESDTSTGASFDGSSWLQGIIGSVAKGYVDVTTAKAQADAARAGNQTVTPQGTATASTGFGLDQKTLLLGAAVVGVVVLVVALRK